MLCPNGHTCERCIICSDTACLYFVYVMDTCEWCIICSATVRLYVVYVMDMWMMHYLLRYSMFILCICHGHMWMMRYLLRYYIFMDTYTNACEVYTTEVSCLCVFLLTLPYYYMHFTRLWITLIIGFYEISMYLNKFSMMAKFINFIQYCNIIHILWYSLRFFYILKRVTLFCTKQ